eukprot:CAMPEP_0182906604 /NCGR_PEP_ID=MMETSP0034_2-20130328/33862_1 /TAXON_ID=156128 /ORGANISM="Nephroselmis pyriformis, Strain CCMP717" /LENGTH=44 /DNA_ID= /DNA_START= /DNA_END= /DNA_ORIENTATION=
MVLVLPSILPERSSTTTMLQAGQPSAPGSGSPAFRLIRAAVRPW